VYNVQKYLHQCVDSLVGQTFRDLEIILVNDGSKDSSPAIMEEYAARYPNVRCIHKPNGGCATARNAGLRAARGEYVGFVDGDDWVDTSMYQVLHDLLLMTRADLVQCGFNRYFETTKSWEPEPEQWVEDMVHHGGYLFDRAKILCCLQPTIWRRI